MIFCQYFVLEGWERRVMTQTQALSGFQKSHLKYYKRKYAENDSDWGKERYGEGHSKKKSPEQRPG